MTLLWFMAYVERDNRWVLVFGFVLESKCVNIDVQWIMLDNPLV